MKRLSLIAVVLIALIAGSFGRKAQAAPVVSGHCTEPFTAPVYCEYETDPQSELKRITFCICYNFMTGELYSD